MKIIILDYIYYDDHCDTHPCSPAAQRRHPGSSSSGNNRDSSGLRPRHNGARGLPFLQPAPLPVRRAAPLRLHHSVRHRGERTLGVPFRRHDDIVPAHQAVGLEYFRCVRADPRPDTDAAAQRPDHGDGAYGGGIRRGRTGDDGEDRAGCRRVVRTCGGNHSASGSIEMKNITFRNMVSPTPKKYIYYVVCCVQSVYSPY